GHGVRLIGDAVDEFGFIGVELPDALGVVADYHANDSQSLVTTRMQALAPIRIPDQNLFGVSGPKERPVDEAAAKGQGLLITRWRRLRPLDRGSRRHPAPLRALKRLLE